MLRPCELLPPQAHRAKATSSGFSLIVGQFTILRTPLFRGWGAFRRALPAGGMWRQTSPTGAVPRGFVGQTGIVWSGYWPKWHFRFNNLLAILPLTQASLRLPLTQATMQTE